MNKFRIELAPETYIIWAWVVLLLPLRFALAFAVAAIFHELCHIIAILCLRGTIHSIRIGSYGAQIETAPMRAAQELAAAAAGPLGGLILLLTFRKTPYLALCALVQSLYNLLPIFPLDGGRMLYAASSIIMGDTRGMRFAVALGRLTAICILCIGIWLGFFQKQGILPPLIAFKLFACAYASSHAEKKKDGTQQLPEIRKHKFLSEM